MTNDLHIVTENYNSHQIALNNFHRFAISGPAVDDIRDDGRDYENYHKACEAIDDAIKALEKQTRVQASVAIVMLDTAGNPVTIRGINAGHGQLLGTEGSHVYPDVPWVREMLIEQIAVVKRRNRLAKILSQVQVAAKRGYGRIAADNYTGAVEGFVKEAAVAKEKAETNAGKVEEMMKP